MKNIETVCFNLKNCLCCLYSDEYKAECKKREYMISELQANIRLSNERIELWKKTNDVAEFCLDQISYPCYRKLELEYWIEERKQLIKSETIKLQRMEDQLKQQDKLVKKSNESNIRSNYTDSIITRCQDVDNESISIHELTELMHEIKIIINSFDNKIDEILNRPISGRIEGGAYKANTKKQQKELEILAEERYGFSKYLGKVEEALYRKKRASFTDHSKKALNAGGIYNGPSTLILSTNTIISGITL